MQAFEISYRSRPGVRPKKVNMQGKDLIEVLNNFKEIYPLEKISMVWNRSI